MALIACPVCGKQISSSAPVCPGCGHPLLAPRKPATGLWLGCGCVVATFFAVLLLTVIGLLIWIGINLMPVSDEDQAPDTVAVETSREREKCQANLDEIARLKEEWAAAHHARKGAVIPEADVETIFAAKKNTLICPEDDDHSLKTSYEIGPIGVAPKCKCDAAHNAAAEESP